MSDELKPGQGLSPATLAILRAGGYTTRAQLEAASVVDLMRLPRFGKTRFAEVSAALGRGSPGLERAIKEAKALLERHGYRVEKL